MHTRQLISQNVWLHRMNLNLNLGWSLSRMQTANCHRGTMFIHSILPEQTADHAYASHACMHMLVNQSIWLDESEYRCTQCTTVQNKQCRICDRHRTARTAVSRAANHVCMLLTSSGTHVACINHVSVSDTGETVRHEQHLHEVTISLMGERRKLGELLQAIRTANP